MTPTRNSSSARPAKLRVPTRKSAVKIAAWYAGIGTLWIVGSGWALHRFVSDPVWEATLETFKGWFYVAATALLLGGVLDRYFRRLRLSALELEASEARLRKLGENLPVGYVYQYSLGADGHRSYSYISAGVERVHEVTAAEVLNNPACLNTRLDPSQLAALRAAEAESARTLTDFEMDLRVRRGDGQERLIRLQSRPHRAEDGTVQWDGFALDITEQRRTEIALQESEARFRALFDYCPEGAMAVDVEDKRILLGNAAMCRLLGCSAEELVRLRTMDLHPEASLEQVMVEFGRLARGDVHVVSSVPMRRKDGSEFLVDISASPFPMGGRRCMVGLFRDTTERRRAERLQALSIEVLRILNDPLALPEATERILQAIQQASGIEAVGIRLRQGEDFPYTVAHGFSAEFLAAENSLAARRPEGGFCLDEHGRVRLECTCGLVLAGQTDPGNPLFTSAGSAWTADARELPATGTGPDARLHPRNRCLHEGFRSVALIPIRVKEEIVGLLQLNDRRSGCLDLETVRFYEGLASSFGVALLRLKEEAALRESQNRLRALFDAVPESLFLMDLRGEILAANAGFAARFGKRVDDCIGASLFELVPERLVESRRAWIAEVVNTRAPVVREEAWGERWLRHHYCPVLGAGEQVDRVVALAVDITERKRAEEKLRESERVLRLALEAGQIGAFEVELDSGQATWSSEVEEIWGMPAGFTGDFQRYCWEHIHLEDLDGVKSFYLKLLHEDREHERELRIVRPDGTVRWIRWRGRLIADSAAGTRRVVGVNLDITERRRLEQEREASLAKYQTLFDAFPLGIVVTNRQGRILESNRVAEEILGLPREEQAERHVGGPEWSVVRPDGTPMPAEEFASIRALREQRRVGEVEMGLVRAPGDLRWISVTAAPVPVPDLGVVITFGDITARKRAEEALVAEATRRRILIEGSRDGIVVLDPQGRVTEANPQFARMLGYSPEEVRRLHVWDWDGQWNREQLLEAIQVLGPTGDHFETRHRRKDGSMYEVEVSTHGAVLEGQKLVFCVCRDITERKQAAEALRQSEARFRGTLEAMMEGCQIIGFDWRYRFVNSAVARQGHSTVEALMGRTMMEAYPGFETTSTFARLTACMSQRLPVQFEDEFVFPDGSLGWFQLMVQPVPEGIFILSLDITERKQAEAALRESELRRSMAMEAAQMGTWDLESASGRLVWAGNTEALWGFEPGTFPGTADAFASRVHPDDLPGLQQVGERARQKRTPFQYEYRVVWPDGSVHWVSSHGRHLFNPEGRVVRVVGVVFDITDRKRVEEALRQSLLFRREAEKIARMGAWMANPATDHVYWTEGVHEILEVPTDRKLGLRAGLKYYDPESIPILEASLEAALRDGAPFTLVAGATTESGRHLWAEVRGLGRVEEGGQAFVMGTFQDVTLRRQAEERVARDALRTEFLLELHQRAAQMSDDDLYDYVLDRAVHLTQSAIGFFHQVSEDQRTVLLTTWNQEAMKTCTAAFDRHYPVAEAGNWVDCIRERRPVVYNDFDRSPHQRGLPEGHTPVRRFMAIPVIREDKVRIIFGVGNKATDYDEDDVAQLQVVANELHKIMTQRAAQARLRESEERFRHLVEATGDWIWQVDAEGRYTYTSPRVQLLLGYPPTEVLGKSLFDYMTAGEAPRVRALFQEKASQRAAFSGLENTNLHRDGHEVVLESSGVPILGPRGELLGYRGVDRDVSERKRLEAQLRQAQKLEAMGQLAGGVAHDFNNMLAAIMMYLGLLQMNSSLDEETRRALKELSSEARRAASLTRQLLMFSRRSVLSVKPLDLNDVVANLLKMLGRLIGENIKLRFDPANALPPVEADAGMLEQVLMNLVVNARDAMPAGGRITIATMLEALGEAEIAHNANRQLGRFVCLTVSDTGTGMDEATLKRIFEPFFTTKEPGKGTGLGLATVHGIVAQHKGWVEVDSHAGQGTTFRVFLPALRVAPPIAAEAALSAPPQGGRETVLVVEDEARVRQAASQTLRELGYRVHEAANGQEAMRLWQRHGAEIDLLLTDMVMPEGMTGLELTENLQTLKPGLKAIISSGYSAEITQLGVPNRRGVTYLPKPYDVARLAEVVRQCLDAKSGA